MLPYHICSSYILNFSISTWYGLCRMLHICLTYNIFENNYTYSTLMNHFKSWQSSCEHLYTAFSAPIFFVEMISLFMMIVSIGLFALLLEQVINIAKNQVHCAVVVWVYINIFMYLCNTSPPTIMFHSKIHRTVVPFTFIYWY